MVPQFSLFVGLVAMVSIFGVLTLVSYYFGMLVSAWVYLLLLLEAVEMVYVELTVQCFVGGAWCGSDAKLQTGCAVLFVVFCLVMVLRSYCYYPLYETSNPLSM